MFQADFLEGRVPIVDTISRWLAYNRRYTLRTQEHYRMVINKFSNRFPGITIGKLTTYHIENYINRLLIDRTNRTGNSHLTVLKSFCRWLARNYGVPNVAENVEMLKEDPPDQRFLTHEEYLKVLEVCNENESDNIKFLANTGLRASEACSLTWDCVGPLATAITLTGKGRKRRIIPLNKVCRDILSKYPRQPKTHIQFLESKRHRLYRLCRKTAIKAGIPIFGPHALRHYFATELLMRGVPISYVSQLLGHSSIRTTQEFYVHFQSAHLMGVTDVLTC